MRMNSQKRERVEDLIIRLTNNMDLLKKLFSRKCRLFHSEMIKILIVDLYIIQMTQRELTIFLKHQIFKT